MKHQLMLTSFIVYLLKSLWLCAQLITVCQYSAFNPPGSLKIYLKFLIPQLKDDRTNSFPNYSGLSLASEI